MNNKRINVTQPSMPTFEEYTKAIKPIFESKWVTNMGGLHKEFESELEKYLNISNVTLTANGHLALENAITAFHLKRGGEIITTPFSFASTTHAIVRCGFKPVFCDINPDDYTMDVNKIEELITSETVAIVPVHVYGNICNTEAIEKIAKKHNLKVIYDAAHTFGEWVGDKCIASFGDASIFSFHATKVFNSIEGGCVAYEQDALESTLNNLKNFGITGIETVESIGGNAKLNEFQAAMGLCNLKHIEEEIAKRKRVVNKYQEILGEIEGIKSWTEQENVKHNYSYFPVVFDKEVFGEDRDEVYNRLREHNIFARKYFYPIIPDYDCYRNQFSGAEVSTARKISDNILTLPLYADLDLESVAKVCEVVLNRR